MGATDLSLRQVRAVYIMADATGTFGSTTLTAAAAAGATTLTVAGITNFADGDDIRVGSGETLELARISGAPTGSTITLAKPLLFPHPVGEAVVEQRGLNFGEPEAAGIPITLPADTTDVDVATRRLAFGKLNGYVSMRGSFELPITTVHALAMALGIAPSNVYGDGTVAAQTGSVGPYLLTTDGNLIGTATNMSVVILGELENGTLVKISYFGCSWDYTGISIQLARGVLAKVPLKFMAAAGGTLEDGLASWTPSTLVTYPSSKAYIFDALTEVGEMIDSANTTTLTAGLNGGEYAITVASGAGLAATAGSWIRVGTEYHQVHSVVTNTVNLRTRIAGAIANGAAVVTQTLTPWSGIDEQGVTLAVSGNVTERRLADKRMIAGLRPGKAEVSLAMQTLEMTPTAFRRALGQPASAYANGRLHFNNTIGTSFPQALYVRGTTQGGHTVWLVGWNPSVVVNVNTTLQQTDFARLPITEVPQTLQVLLHA